jgi:CheY-like chemotaxis protein
MKAILFVDDHEVLARLSCEILRMHGYRAECAYNAADALSRFEHDQFDLVVTDYRMEGMDGVELAKRLRLQSPELPIIIVSGYAPLEACDWVSSWIEKQDMFPALLDKIGLLLNVADPEAAESETIVNRA